MCGRYSITVSKKRLAQEFGIPEECLENLVPRYNIAPSQTVPVLLREGGKELPQSEEPFHLEWVHWGLIPPWAKDRTSGYRMINARKETLREKPSFKGPYKGQRCLIPADGFFEWKMHGNSKIPYHIRMKSGAPFTFAGLWSRWSDPEGKELRSCAIITGEPNELVGSIHNRMPVILPRESREAWVDPANQDIQSLHNLLEVYPAKEMEAYPVSRLVNSPQNDTAECIRPVRIPTLI